ncbi:MAG TPA: hypothetical protein ENK16_04560, partial [Chromatiales bacterium]|nr:hypothetical protein [Chromatiales bacterium]
MVDLDLLHSLPDEVISYREQVQPVLERRCVVCHGCFDAPCQLKLSAYEGITRGANRKKVYDGSRIRAVQPNRLFIDAKTPAQWRERGFSPVLHEGGQNDPLQNLEGSVLYRMLRLKQLNPQPRTGMLPDSFDLELDRKQVCAKPDEFDRFSRDHPLWGMPYAMPNLDPDEYKVLVQWLAQGAPAPQAGQPSAQAQAQIIEWERFLNQPGKKQRLVSRYLYEHLFHAHIHFSGTSDREFYRLIRSTTPTGVEADEIPTVRPFDDPGTSSFYYRLVPYQASIVAKAHLPYEFSPQRMARFRELFLKPDYVVTQLPGYDQRIASNPFKSFAALPPDARYRFLLDDARFFINGFIKGPVCRGQVALNVIDDQFWVVFFDPDRKLITSDSAFLSEVADYLQMPAEWGNSTLKLLKPWTEYSTKQRAYRQARDAQLSGLKPMELDQALEYIWDGDGQNRNAALTVFRHFDSAAVEYGFVGDYPETAWMIDYPLFERIHYLLVAGFDVYGNVGH